MIDNLLLLVQAPELGLQLMVDGILIGAVFCLAAYGMALVWGVMNLINVAQGELVMLGGYVALGVVRLGLPPLAGVPVAAAVLYGVGWLLYRGIVFRLVDRDLFVSILATFGISIVIQQALNQLVGADIQTLDAHLGSVDLAGGTVTVPRIKLVSLAAVLLLGLALALFLKRTRIGQAIRATAQNARAARILGIDTGHVYATTFALNAAICGAAGALVAMIWVIHPYIGLPYTLRSFMIVVVAGLGNLPAVIVAGLGLGAAEQFAGFVLGAEFQMGFVFALLVVLLVGRNLRLQAQRRYLK